MSKLYIMRGLKLVCSLTLGVLGGKTTEYSLELGEGSEEERKEKATEAEAEAEAAAVVAVAHCAFIIAYSTELHCECVWKLSGALGPLPGSRVESRNSLSFSLCNCFSIAAATVSTTKRWNSILTTESCSYIGGTSLLEQRTRSSSHENIRHRSWTLETIPTISPLLPRSSSCSQWGRSTQNLSTAQTHTPPCLIWCESQTQHLKLPTSYYQYTLQHS